MKNLSVLILAAIGAFFYFRHYISKEYNTQNSCTAMAKATSRAAPQVFEELGKRYGEALVALFFQRMFDSDNRFLKQLVEEAVKANTGNQSQLSCAFGLAMIDLNLSGKHDELVDIVAISMNLKRQLSIENSCNSRIIVSHIVLNAGRKSWIQGRDVVDGRQNKNTATWVDGSEIFYYATTESGSAYWGEQAGKGAYNGTVTNANNEKKEVGFLKHSLQSNVGNKNFPIVFKC